jgi:hypothetical protein
MQASKVMNNSIPDIWKTVKRRLESEKDLAKRDALQAEIDTLKGKFDPEKRELDVLMKLKSATDDEEQRVVGLTQRYKELGNQATALHGRLVDITRPAQLGDDKRNTRREIGEIREKIEAARTMLAEALREALVGSPSQDEATRHLGKLERGLQDLDQRIAADAGEKKEMPALREDLAVARKRQEEISRAKELASLGGVAKAIEKEVKKIRKIIQENTKGEVGEHGSSEEAVMVEVRTGIGVKGKFHGRKCINDGQGLDDAIAELVRLKGKTADRALHKIIDDALSDARDRRAGLKIGANAWLSAPKDYPKIWASVGVLISGKRVDNG